MSLCPLVNSAVASGQLSFDVAGMLGPLYIGIPASALWVSFISCVQHTSDNIQGVWYNVLPGSVLLPLGESDAGPLGYQSSRVLYDYSL